MRYRLTAKASQDLIALTEYSIETFGQQQARKYHQALERTFELLADMPQMGPEDAHFEGCRRFLHGRHVILYHLEEDQIVIVRLLHVAMDQGRHAVDD